MSTAVVRRQIPANKGNSLKRDHRHSYHREEEEEEKVGELPGWGGDGAG